MSVGEVAQVITAFTALAALMTSLLNRSKIQEVKLSLNSRLTELIAANALVAHAEGVEHERERTKNGGL